MKKHFYIIIFILCTILFLGNFNNSYALKKYKNKTSKSKYLKGIIKKISQNEITVEKKARKKLSFNLKITDKTKIYHYTAPKTVDINGVNNLKIGLDIKVIYNITTLEAKKITILEKSERFSGKVQSITGDKLIIQNFKRKKLLKSYELTISNKTKITKNRKKIAFSEIKTGDWLKGYFTPNTKVITKCSIRSYKKGVKRVKRIR